MKRFRIADRSGYLRRDNSMWNAPTIGYIGPYEVRYAGRPGPDLGREFLVVCDPVDRKPGHWNVTGFSERRDGTLEPRDEDVVLDPYHMCLLYQLITGADDG